MHNPQYLCGSARYDMRLARVKCGSERRRIGGASRTGRAWGAAAGSSTRRVRCAEGAGRGVQGAGRVAETKVQAEMSMREAEMTCPSGETNSHFGYGAGGAGGTGGMPPEGKFSEYCTTILPMSGGIKQAAGVATFKVSLLPAAKA